MATERVKFIPGYGDLMRRIQDVNSREAARVDDMYSRALGYVWGRIDAGGVFPAYGDSMDFATSYATHVLDRAESGTTHDLRSAFDQWMKTGVIA